MSALARLETHDTIVVKRQVEEVFVYVQDIEREHEWQPSLVEARQLTGGPLGVGTRRHYVNVSMGRRLVTTYLVTAFEANREITYESTRDSTLWSRWHIACEAMGAWTRLDMRVQAEITGFLRVIPRVVLAATARHELRTLLQRLKRRLEEPP